MPFRSRPARWSDWSWVDTGSTDEGSGIAAKYAEIGQVVGGGRRRPRTHHRARPVPPARGWLGHHLLQPSRRRSGLRRA
jgi:hypothetical protein